jgi:hypothetical protein
MKMSILLENNILTAKGSQAKKSTQLKIKENNVYSRINNENVTYDFDNPISDLVISFGGVPFYFKKAVFIDAKEVNPEEYTGTYYSEELDVNYQFYTKEDKLYLDYPNNKNIALSTVQKDEFGNNQRTLYQFVKNENNIVIKMKLSCEGSVKEIEFMKR